MSRAAAFKQADLTRAIKGARKAGLPIGQVVVAPNGEIRILLKDGGEGQADRPNDFDREFG